MASKLNVCHQLASLADFFFALFSPPRSLFTGYIFFSDRSLKISEKMRYYSQFYF